MKYLMLVPCHNVAHLLPYFFSCLKGLNPKPNHIIFSVHNITDKTTEMIRNFELENCKIELMELPDFPKDFAQKFGEFEHMAIIRQKLWERARTLSPRFVFMIDADMFIMTKNALDILSGWNVDFVVATQIHRALHYEGTQVFVSAKFLDGTRPKIAAVTLRLSNGVVVARPFGKLNAIYDNVQWAGGFYCFSNRLLQDARLNWHPIIEMTDQEKKHNPHYRQAAEDCSFCHKARVLGYRIYLDGLVTVDHLVEDPTKPKKAWNTANYEFPTTIERRHT